MASVSRTRRMGKYFLLLDNLLVILGFFVVMPLISIRLPMSWAGAASIVGLALGLWQLTSRGWVCSAAPWPTASAPNRSSSSVCCCASLSFANRPWLTAPGSDRLLRALRFGRDVV